MKRSQTKITILAFALLSIFLFQPHQAVAVDELGIFELDSDANDVAAIPGDDWDTLFYCEPNSSLVFTGILNDPGQQTVFTGGHKDIQDISKWGWKNNGGFPDKDDITNAYAAAYTDQGDLIVYFGCDRFANSGDAYLAFWFFKDRIELNQNGSFSGKHTVGDMLVLVNFPQGNNAKPTISVAKWNPANPTAATNIELISFGTQNSGSAVVCTDDGLACAITNLTPVNSPWPYTPKSGTAGVFPYESFFEGGINLTQLLHTTTCFASFMAESRSSQQFSATLKDFVIGKFPVCAASVVKQCDVNRPTDNTVKSFVVDFNGVVTNTGAVPWPAGSSLRIVDDAGTPGAGNTADDIIITKTLSSDLPVKQSIPFSGQFISSLNPPYNSVTASVKFPGSTAADIYADQFGISCDPMVIPTSLSLSKLCWTELVTENNLLAVKVFFTGEVTNTGKAPLLVTVTDDKAGTVLGPITINPDANEIFFGSYLPPQADGDVNIPSKARFTDTVTATGKSSTSGAKDANDVIKTANCPLCDCNDK